jgi:Glycoside-hydrolase family GH114
MVTARHRFRAVAVGLLASTALLAGVLGCAAVPQSSPVAIAPTSLSPRPLAASTTARAARRPVPIVLPPVAGRFDYQLGGAYPPPSGTTVVERDRSIAPARRTYGICYVNAFQTQPEELHWWKTRHPRVLLAVGRTYIQDPDWPGEVLLDTSTAAKRTEAAAVVGGWIDRCAAKGYRAVELDNLDSWTRSRRKLTAASSVAFARLLVVRAHAKRLAVAQKNAPELSPQRRRIGFDFAVAEECQVYGECGAYTSAYGRHVIEVEYTDNPLAAFVQACAARGRQISVVLRDRDLVPAGDSGYVYRRC